jgi:hypothetical protein
VNICPNTVQVGLSQIDLAGARASVVQSFSPAETGNTQRPLAHGWLLAIEDLAAC